MDLAARTLELVDVASESRDEAALSAHVLDAVPGARDAGDTCVLAGATARGSRPLVLLAGHLDTVPAQGNRPGRTGDGWVHGLGAADMKGALAVMVELALAAPSLPLTVDLGFVFFGREELPVAESALTPLLAREPGLCTADLAIVMEPTDNALQAGCLGNVNARMTARGVSAHSARPWLGDNAIHRLASGIAAVAAAECSERTFAGLTYREAVSVTGVTGGIAANVVPAEASALVNYRYAPGRAAGDAEAWVRSLWDGGEWEIVSNAPSGPVPVGNELVDRLRAVDDLAWEPKQAWTPVAELGLVGVDAVNFGPGDPQHAHKADERVSVAALQRSYAILERFACA